MKNKKIIKTKTNEMYICVGKTKSKIDRINK